MGGAPRQSKRIRNIVGGLGLAALTSAAGAADYSAGTSVRVEGNYVDNARLTESDPISLSGSTVAPKFTLGVETERSDTTLDGNLWFRRFNRSEFDSDDQELRFNTKHSGERVDMSLGASMLRDSTLTSELLDSGRVANAQRHEQYQATPSISFFLSERNLISFQGAYSTNRYRGDQFTNYDYWQAGLQWTYMLNERLRFFSQYNHSDYQSDPRQSSFGQSYSTRSIDDGVQVGGEYALSEAFTVSALIGRTRNDSRYDIDDPNNACIFLGPLLPACSLEDGKTNLSTGTGTLSWSNTRNQLSASLTQDTRPSSDGYKLESRQLNLRWSYSVWERGTLSTELTAGENKALGGDSLSKQSDRDFRYANIAYRHRLDDAWYLDGKYQYRFQDYTNTDDSAESQGVYFGITYQPRDWHWHR